jgi:hypothetical protein
MASQWIWQGLILLIALSIIFIAPASDNYTQALCGILSMQNYSRPPGDPHLKRARAESSQPLRSLFRNALDTGYLRLISSQAWTNLKTAISSLAKVPEGPDRGGPFRSSLS